MTGKTVAVEDENICNKCVNQLERTTEYMGLSGNQSLLLEKPEKVYTFRVPLRLDGGGKPPGE